LKLKILADLILFVVPEIAKTKSIAIERSSGDNLKNNSMLFARRF